MKDNQITYQATAAANVVITAKPAYLEKIIVGADVAASVVEVSDHPSNGTSNVKVYLGGSTIMTSIGGEIEVEAVFAKGITMTLTNQTKVGIVWRPM